ncbi:MAG TPA: hypothetical protein VI854_09710, partial [Acidimicrobiia bacterium]|nr:hypothetical protein [Acidimicrobiia bacterium]
MIRSDRWRQKRSGLLLVTLLGASVVAGGMPARGHHEPTVPDDPHTYTAPHAGVVAPPRATGRLAPASGALLGVHPEDRHTGTLTPEHQHILDTEEAVGRRMDINNNYYQFFDIARNWDPARAAVPFDAANPATYDGRGLSRLAYWDVSLGRIPLVSWACQNSSNVNRGEYDEEIRNTGEAFKALGAEFFMRYCWEMDGSKRIKDADDDDNDGNRSEDHVGSPEDFIRAWNRIYDIIAAPEVPMTHEVPLNVERVGAKNVVWVWCGNAAHFKDTNDAGHYAWDYYPGDATVDWISADGYNWALSRRNMEADYERDRWRGFVEIFDEFMVWARWTPASGPVTESMRFDEDGKPTGVPEAFPRKGAVRPIQIGEYGAIEPSAEDQSDPNDDRQEHYLSIAPHLTKPDWIQETHDAVNGNKASQWSMDGCHWCGIYSDIAAMVYFDINADGSGQNGDWRIKSSPASTQAYVDSAAQDPWFKQIHNVGWPQAANSNYTSTPPPGPGPGTTPTTQPPGTTPTTQPPGTGGTSTDPTAGRSGYWMLGSNGKVYPFGEARSHGDGASPAGAVDIEPSPSGNGYWIVDAAGKVIASGDAKHHGDVSSARLAAGEKVTSLSATPSGNGYWVFTTRGRAVTFGDASAFGDMSDTVLNGPVLDSIPTPSGRGYYMVASDGGIFAFGDAAFHGSMGGIPLNAPVQSLVPDPDGKGYWLVAS